MNKGKIKQIITSKIGVAIITGFVCFNIGGIIASSPTTEATSTTSTLQSELDASNTKISELESENQTLQLKVEEAQPWFDMKEEERQAQQAEAEKSKAEAEAKKAQEEAEAQAAAKKAQEEAEAQAAAEAKKGYDTGITYNQLARTPDDYLAKKVKFTGKVIQVMEGDTETQIRLAVNNDYDNILYCGVPKTLTNNNRILENDTITVYGLSLGLLSYQSTMGGNITIPAIMVDKFD